MRTWSDFQFFQLATLYPHMTTRDCAAIIGKPESHVKCAATRMKIGKEGYHYQPGSQYSNKQQKFIRANYLTMPIKQIAEKIGGSFTGIQGMLNREGLVIPPEIVAQRKNIGMFAKGNPPVNKGKKWSEFMSKEGMKNSRKTQFKKGQRVHKEGKNGDIRIRHNHKERGDKPYKWIRLRKAKWEMLHVHLWKKNNGRIPKGMIVVFKDGDTMHCEVENLELITREQNMNRNTIHRYPQELKDVIRLTNKVSKKLKEHHEKQITRPEKSPLRAA